MVRGLPPMLNISGITPSKFAAGRVYLTVDGHFNDDYRPYVFVSEDYGETWRAIAGGLPQASVHRLREHPRNADVLVAGLETGVYLSLDRGMHWTALGSNLPPVPVYDLAFQESTGALVAGTHGRGIWVLDHAEPLAQAGPGILSGGARLFPVPTARRETVFGGQFWFGAGEFFAPNPPAGAVLTWYLPKGAAKLDITVRDAAGETVRTLHGAASHGLNRVCWDLRRDPAVGPAPEPSCVAAATTSTGFPRGGGAGPLVPPGKYTVRLAVPGSDTIEAEVNVLPDPRSPVSDADRSAHDSALFRSWSLQRQLAGARDSGRAVATQVSAMRDSAKAAGESGGEALTALDRISADLNRAQGQIASASAMAARVQAAVDSFEGLPTEAQLRELEWAWSDARAAVAALNQAIAALPATVGSALKWREVKPVVLQP
jgi:hypothetical protein